MSVPSEGTGTMKGQVVQFPTPEEKMRRAERRRIVAALRASLERISGEAANASLPLTAEMAGATLLLLDQESAE
jgi:hypothetical protein